MKLSLLPTKSVKSRVEALIDKLMSRERRANIEEALLIAKSWMPSGEHYSYIEEMQNRVDYFLGSMQSDMAKVLKRRFPKTYDDLKNEQVNIRLVRRLILSRAKVFSGDCEFYLERNGERLNADDPNSLIFNYILNKSNFRITLSDLDARTQLCHRCAAKIWWNKNHVRVSAFEPHLVFLIPNPDREWDADACYAQLFKRPGSSGLGSRPRYEVWGIRDTEAAEVTGQDTIHFVTDGENDTKINEEDVNPFLDPLTGKPMYPMVWWQDDTQTALYVLHDEDLLTLNRMINAGLTDLFQNIHFQSFGIPVYELPPGGGVEPPATRILSPRHAVDLPPGVKLTFVSPQLQVTEVSNFFQLMIKLEALLDGQSPSAVRVEGQQAASGYALKIENVPLIEHRNALIPIYKPYVEETLRRMIIVWNTYSEDKIDEDLQPVWVPGEVEYPVDTESLGRQYAQEIMYHVSSPVEWRMERYGETRQQAEEAIRRNREINDALLSVKAAAESKPEFVKEALGRIGLTQTVEEEKEIIEEE